MIWRHQKYLRAVTLSLEQPLKKTKALLAAEGVGEKTAEDTRCDVGRVSRGVSTVAARQLKVVAAGVHGGTNGCVGRDRRGGAGAAVAPRAAASEATEKTA